MTVHSEHKMFAGKLELLAHIVRAYYSRQSAVVAMAKPDSLSLNIL